MVKLKITQKYFLLILVALIINFFNLIDRDRVHSIGADELTYFAYAYNIHHFDTFDHFK